MISLLKYTVEVRRRGKQRTDYALLARNPRARRTTISRSVNEKTFSP